MCLVLSILRVLMAQTKEEVVLSRINELGLRLHVFKTTDPELTEREKLLVEALTPEEVMARYVRNGLWWRLLHQRKLWQGI